VTVLQIRHADPARDAASCAEIYAPFVSDSAVSFEEEPPTAAEFERRIAATAERHPWLIAEVDCKLAGFAYASRHRERAAYRWAADVSVYVHDAFRRRGVATVLYRTLLELLVRQGVRIACAGVTLPNEPSVSLHESLGFRPVGVYSRIGWKAGAWRDVGWWELELLPAEGEPREPGPPARLEDIRPATGLGNPNY
jgi:L-amino acid N-acyltransferase YncA